jgi:hypothetical protein
MSLIFQVKSFGETNLNTPNVLNEIKELWEKYPESFIAFEDPKSETYHVGMISLNNEDITHFVQCSFLCKIPKTPIETIGQRIQEISKKHDNCFLLEFYFKTLSDVDLYKIKKVFK